MISNLALPLVVFGGKHGSGRVKRAVIDRFGRNVTLAISTLSPVVLFISTNGLRMRVCVYSCIALA